MEKISEEHLKKIHELTDKRKDAKVEAQNAVLVSKIAELEYDNFVLLLHIMYNLKLGKDSIANNDGTIKRAEQLVQPEQRVEQIQEGEK